MMKKVYKALSFLLVISSGIFTICKMNKSNKEMISKETTSLQIKQTLSAIAATLEKTEAEEKTDVADKEAPLIKGNKNARGEYIYHMPGGVFYNRTTPVEWFHTEEEAQEKGYRKSAR